MKKTKLVIMLLTMVVGIIISATLVLPFEVYVIRDIAKLYNVDLIINTPKEVLFGIVLIVGIFKINMNDYKDSDKSKKEEDETGILASVMSLLRIAGFALVVLLCWGCAYLVHNLNHFQ